MTLFMTADQLINHRISYQWASAFTKKDEYLREEQYPLYPPETFASQEISD